MRQIKKLISIKRLISNPRIRRLSTDSSENADHLDSWIKIHKEMRNEARDIVQHAIDSRTSQMNHDVSSIKSDVLGIKSDVKDLTARNCS